MEVATMFKKIPEVTAMAGNNKIKVLFVCVHNSARSQMAEALLNQMAGDRYSAQSAGLEPGTLNPLAIEVLREIGIDISQNQTKDVFKFFQQGNLFNYVVTVCDGTQAERCPIFPGHTERVHCSFPDPAALTGSHEEQLARTREIRNQIKAWLEQWIKV
jgi:arsenate reductase